MPLFFSHYSALLLMNIQGYWRCPYTWLCSSSSLWNCTHYQAGSGHERKWHIIQIWTIFY